LLEVLTRSGAVVRGLVGGLFWVLGQKAPIVVGVRGRSATRCLKTSRWRWSSYQRAMGS